MAVKKKKRNQLNNTLFSYADKKESEERKAILSQKGAPNNSFRSSANIDTFSVQERSVVGNAPRQNKKEERHQLTVIQSSEYKSGKKAIANHNVDNEVAYSKDYINEEALRKEVEKSGYKLIKVKGTKAMFWPGMNIVYDDHVYTIKASKILPRRNMEEYLKNTVQPSNEVVKQGDLFGKNTDVNRKAAKVFYVVLEGLDYDHDHPQELNSHTAFGARSKKKVNQQKQTRKLNRAPSKTPHAKQYEENNYTNSNGYENYPRKTVSYSKESRQKNSHNVYEAEYAARGRAPIKNNSSAPKKHFMPQKEGQVRKQGAGKDPRQLRIIKHILKYDEYIQPDDND